MFKKLEERMLNLVLCDNLEVWDMEEEGRGSGERGHMYTCDWLMLMCGRNQHNIVKQLPSNLKKNLKTCKNNKIKLLEMKIKLSEIKQIWQMELAIDQTLSKKNISELEDTTK